MTAIDMTPVFERVLVAGGQGMALAALVLGAQRLLGRWLGPAWRSALWWVVVARLLLPWTPGFSGSFYSIGNLAPTTLGRLGGEPVVQVTYGVPTPAPGAPGLEAAAAIQPSGASTIWSLAAWIWIAGVVAFWMWAAAGVVSLGRRVRVGQRAAGREVLDEFDQACRSLGVRRTPPVMETGAVGSPGLFGFLSPVLLLPRGLAEKLSNGELRHVLLHEAAHLARRDVAFHWVVALTRSLHWFNPLAWMILRRVEEDMEIACDARALAAAQSGEARSYGRTILRLLGEGETSRPTPALVGILRERDQVARRMRALVDPPARSGQRWLAVALFFGLAVGGLSSPPNDPFAPLPQTAAAPTAGDALAEKETLYTRTYKLNPSMLASLLSLREPAADPFTSASDAADQSAKGPQTWLASFFAAKGVEFPPSANPTEPSRKAVFLNERTGVLFVRATLSDLDRVEGVLQEVNTPANVAVEESMLLLDMRVYELPGDLQYLGKLPGSIHPPSEAAQAGEAPKQPARATGVFPSQSAAEVVYSVNATGTIVTTNAAGTVATVSGILTDPQFRQVVSALENQSRPDPFALPPPSMAGVLSAEQAHGVVQALEGNGRVKLLSRPRISTKPGVPASLRMGSSEAEVLEINVAPERLPGGGLELRVGFRAPLAGGGEGQSHAASAKLPFALGQTVMIKSQTVSGRAAMVFIAVTNGSEKR